MHSSVTSIGSIRQQQRRRKQGEENDRSRAIHTWSGQRGARAKGWRELDTRSRQGAAPLAGKSLARADRAGAAARMGAIRQRWESRYGWNDSEAHDSWSAITARDRNDGDASRRPEGT